MSNRASFEDIVEQYLDCCKKGSSPDIEEFAKQYPEHSDELLEILPLLQDLEELGNKKNSQTTQNEHFLPDLTTSDYRLLKKIGIGGMGIVFEAEQISLGRKVAIKLLSQSLVTDKTQREQFEKEARIIAMLHHPNIVKIYSAKCSPQYCYYAMELVEGKGLNQYQINNIKEIAKIGLQAAKAIAYAHSWKVMHRDIKPANLLLDRFGQVHVSDFGLAFILKDNIKNIEKFDTKSGTLRYMAPEKVIHGENSFLTDQYSLGVTLYEMVTHKPYVTAATSKDLINKISAGKTPKLNCKESDFAAIVNKCISFNPADRYCGMDELVDDLQHF